MSEAKSRPPEPVAASEFARNFGEYKLRAQKAPVPVSSHGKIAGYFVAADEYEAFLRYKSQRRSFATAELPADKVKAIAKTRMHPRHTPLNAMLDRK
ncbi:MAG TPA: type II toxin-antitoxin system Phd/YefM family antitoxin [Hyphomicrobium sp.]|nr:type II toxin-antitoxin system Phd/YefM family antitoxin [Hyphomicrobium sp.]